MKPIFPVNLCKLVDRLFTEFENADTIRFTGKEYLTVTVQSCGQKLAIIHLTDTTFLTDIDPNTAYDATKIRGAIEYFVNYKEAVSGLELEKSMKKLRAIVHCCQKGGKVLLKIDDKLLETLKVLDSVF